MKQAIIRLCLIVVTSMALVYAYTDVAEADTKNRIMREARSMAGVPYGKGPHGLTCSEYTRLVYGRATGVWMPSWDDKQRFYGISLGKPYRPERGALVLFKEHRGNGRITHVAVADGQGGIWHSSAYYGYVMHLKYMYWVDGYVGARRIR